MKRAAVAIFLALSACRAMDPPNKPEDTCIKACRDRASQKCTDGECRKGCRLALDRIIEHEGDHVLKCVAETKTIRCDDSAWAECSAKIGVHVDGGPPAPPPGKEDFDEGD